MIIDECVCCAGEGDEGCPLCDGLKFFLDFKSLPSDIEEFMIDFYEESPLDVYFLKLCDDEKRFFLDEQLHTYFNNIAPDVTPNCERVEIELE